MRFRLNRPRRSDYQRFASQNLDRLGNAAAQAADETARLSRFDIQGAMGAVKLGKLARSVRYSSDVKKRRVRRMSQARGRWRAGAIVFATGGSDRTAGAFQAYSEGASIIPRRGRWLAIATDEIPSRVGRFRMTPARYETAGLDKRIGELEFIEGKTPGEALLIVRDVTVNAAKGFGQARRQPRRGPIGSSRKKADFIVAFVLIRATRRARRYRPLKIVERRFAQMPALIASYLRGGGKSGAITGPIVAASGGSAVGRFTGPVLRA